MPDKMLIAQGEGFLFRHLELNMEANVPGSERALEWMNILSDGLESYRKQVSELEYKLSQCKIVLG